MIFLPRTTHKFDFFCWQIEQIVFQTFDKSNFKVHWTPGWNIEKVHNMKSLPSSVFEKFLKSLQSQLLRWWMVVVVGASKLRQMSQISKDMSAAAPSPNLDRGWKMVKGKKGLGWGDKRSSEFGIKMYSICGLPCLDCKCAYIQSVPIARNSLSNQELERKRSNICDTKCNMMMMTMRRRMMMAMMTMRWLMMRMMMIALRWLMMRMMCSPAVLLQAVHRGDVVRRHLWV